MRTIVTGIVLEHHKKTDKNDSAKVYHSLIVYEPGKNFPDLLRMNLKPEKVVEVSALVGKECDIEAEVTIFQQKANLSFVSGRPVSARRAA